MRYIYIYINVKVEKQPKNQFAISRIKFISILGNKAFLFLLCCALSFHSFPTLSFTDSTHTYMCIITGKQV